MQPFDEVASFGRQVRLLKDLIEKQVGESAREAGSNIKASMLSPLFMLYKQGALTTADIASRLNDSHQLTSQRINWLSENGLVEVIDCDEDLRRRLNSLTRAGKKEARLIEKYTEKLKTAYQDLFEEIGLDGLAAIKKIHHALETRSLKQRMNE